MWVRLCEYIHFGMYVHIYVRMYICMHICTCLSYAAGRLEVMNPHAHCTVRCIHKYVCWVYTCMYVVLWLTYTHTKTTTHTHIPALHSVAKEANTYTSA